MRNLKSWLSNNKLKIIRFHENKKIKLINEIIIYDDANIVKIFKNVIYKHENISINNDKMIRIFKKNYMPINLKSNWEKNLKTHRMYFLNNDDKKIIDEIFDNFHRIEKMKWSKKFTFFEFSTFVTWRTIVKDEKKIRKDKTMIDIRNLNVIMKKKTRIRCLFKRTSQQQ